MIDTDVTLDGNTRPLRCHPAIRTNREIAAVLTQARARLDASPYVAIHQAARLDRYARAYYARQHETHDIGGEG